MTKVAAMLAAIVMILCAAPASADVGDSAGEPNPRRERAATSRGVAPAVSPLTKINVGPRPVFQNPLWWFGAPNPNAPTPIVTRTFQPLADLPEWQQPYFGWFRNLNFEACVVGFSNVIGPYGTSTSSISRRC
jgi:hypothetical protein